MNLIAAIAALSILAPAQEGMTMKPSAELKKMAYLVGTWKGTGKFYGMGPKPIAVSDTVTFAPAMQGMWLEEKHTAYMDKQIFMVGRQFTTYDDQAKKWKAVWLDNAAPYHMEMTGSFVGSSLVMTSPPMAMPGMAEKVITRATHRKLSDRKFEANIEMQTGGKWAPMITSTYVKVSK